MKEISCIIIDDEELSRALLDQYISRTPNLILKGKYSNPIDSLSAIKKDSIDLIFLDIQMPEMTGIEFLKSLEKSVHIIFTTAYDKYAIEGYNLSVIDYLLKPFSFNRYLQAVNKVIDLIELKQKAEDKLDENIAESDLLLIKADHKTYRLYLKDIIYIQSMREYVTYFLKDYKVMSLGSLKKLEVELPKSQFIRVHKSYIVSVNKIKSYSGNQLELGNIKIPVGGSYKDQVMTMLSLEK